MKNSKRENLLFDPLIVDGDVPVMFVFDLRGTGKSLKFEKCRTTLSSIEIETFTSLKLTGTVMDSRFDHIGKIRFSIVICKDNTQENNNDDVNYSRIRPKENHRPRKKYLKERFQSRFDFVDSSLKN